MEKENRLIFLSPQRPDCPSGQSLDQKGIDALDEHIDDKLEPNVEELEGKLAVMEEGANESAEDEIAEKGLRTRGHLKKEINKIDLGDIAKETKNEYIKDYLALRKNKSITHAMFLEKIVEITGGLGIAIDGLAAIAHGRVNSAAITKAILDKMKPQREKIARERIKKEIEKIREKHKEPLKKIPGYNKLKAKVKAAKKELEIARSKLKHAEKNLKAYLKANKAWDGSLTPQAIEFAKKYYTNEITSQKGKITDLKTLIEKAAKDHKEAKAEFEAADKLVNELEGKVAHMEEGANASAEKEITDKGLRTKEYLEQETQKVKLDDVKNYSGTNEHIKAYLELRKDKNVTQVVFLEKLAKIAEGLNIEFDGLGAILEGRVNNAALIKAIMDKAKLDIAKTRIQKQIDAIKEKHKANLKKNPEYIEAKEALAKARTKKADAKTKMENAKQLEKEKAKQLKADEKTLENLERALEHVDEDSEFVKRRVIELRLKLEGKCKDSKDLKLPKHSMIDPNAEQKLKASGLSVEETAINGLENGKKITIPKNSRVFITANKEEKGDFSITIVGEEGWTTYVMEGKNILDTKVNGKSTTKVTSQAQLKADYRPGANANRINRKGINTSAEPAKPAEEFVGPPAEPAKPAEEFVGPPAEAAKPAETAVSPAAATDKIPYLEEEALKKRFDELVTELEKTEGIQVKHNKEDKQVDIHIVDTRTFITLNQEDKDKGGGFDVWVGKKKPGETEVGDWAKPKDYGKAKKYEDAKAALIATIEAEKPAKLGRRIAATENKRYKDKITLDGKAPKIPYIEKPELLKALGELDKELQKRFPTVSTSIEESGLYLEIHLADKETVFVFNQEDKNKGGGFDVWIAKKPKEGNVDPKSFKKPEGYGEPKEYEAAKETLFATLEAKINGTKPKPEPASQAPETIQKLPTKAENDKIMKKIQGEIKSNKYIGKAKLVTRKTKGKAKGYKALQVQLKVPGTKKEQYIFIYPDHDSMYKISKREYDTKKKAFGPNKVLQEYDTPDEAKHIFKAKIAEHIKTEEFKERQRSLKGKLETFTKQANKAKMALEQKYGTGQFELKVNPTSGKKVIDVDIPEITFKSLKLKPQITGDIKVTVDEKTGKTTYQVTFAGENIKLVVNSSGEDAAIKFKNAIEDSGKFKELKEVGEMKMPEIFEPIAKKFNGEIFDGVNAGTGWLANTTTLRTEVLVNGKAKDVFTLKKNQGSDGGWKVEKNNKEIGEPKGFGLIEDKVKVFERAVRISAAKEFAKRNKNLLGKVAGFEAKLLEKYPKKVAKIENDDTSFKVYVKVQDKPDIKIQLTQDPKVTTKFSVTMVNTKGDEETGEVFDVLKGKGLKQSFRTVVAKIEDPTMPEKPEETEKLEEPDLEQAFSEFGKYLKDTYDGQLRGLHKHMDPTWAIGNKANFTIKLGLSKDDLTSTFILAKQADGTYKATHERHKFNKGVDTLKGTLEGKASPKELFENLLEVFKQRLAYTIKTEYDTRDTKWDRIPDDKLEPELKAMKTRFEALKGVKKVSLMSVGREIYIELSNKAKTSFRIAQYADVKNGKVGFRIEVESPARDFPERVLLKTAEEKVRTMITTGKIPGGISTTYEKVEDKRNIDEHMKELADANPELEYTPKSGTKYAEAKITHQGTIYTYLIKPAGSAGDEFQVWRKDGSIREYKVGIAGGPKDAMHEIKTALKALKKGYKAPGPVEGKRGSSAPATASIRNSKYEAVKDKMNRKAIVEAIKNKRLSKLTNQPNQRVINALYSTVRTKDIATKLRNGTKEQKKAAKREQSKKAYALAKRLGIKMSKLTGKNRKEQFNPEDHEANNNA